MADTLGGVIDKLITVDTKLWNAQDEIYKIRRMTFEEYKQEYFFNEEGAIRLWQCLKKACDLNLQRNQLIDEIDHKIIQMLDAKTAGQDLDNGQFLQNKHKNY